jgi:co-chaperonin GroES (HSP10)
MKYGLEDYEPMGYQVLVRVEASNTTESGIILQKAKAEKFMEVVKCGSMVSALEVGDLILMDAPTQGMVQLKFGDIHYIQIDERNVAGKIPLSKAKMADLIKP